MNGLLDGLPTWATITAVTVGFALTAGVIALVVLAGKRLADRRTNPPTNNKERWKDRALFAGAMIAGATVYGGFVVGSWDGLTAFAREQVGWDDWRQGLVPVTLDGGGAAFALLAVRAIARGLSPYRCYIIVWLSAGASAAFSFTQGGTTHKATAGAYLAYLAIAGMVLLHTFIEQFGKGIKHVAHTYPKFGLRWITYFPNTFCAFLAWINHPPVAGTEPTVTNAVTHLETIRNGKRTTRINRRAEAATFPPAWTRLWPWARNAHLAAALELARNEQAATVRNATDAINARLVEVEQKASQAAAEHALQLEKLEALHHAEIARLQTELTATAARNRRTVAPPKAATSRATTVRTAPATEPVAPPNEEPQLSPVADPGDNETAVQMLVAAHNDPATKWSQNKVKKILAVGWPRAAELVDLVAEYHARNTATAEAPVHLNGARNEAHLEKVTAS